MDALALRKLESTGDIFQDLVQCMTNVKTSICVWRSVMEYEGGVGRDATGRLALPCVKIVGTFLSVFVTIGNHRASRERGLR